MKPAESLALRPRACGRRRAAGVTLIESLVVLAVLGVLATQAVTQLPDLIDRRRVEATASEAAALLQTARWSAQSTTRSLRASFRHDAGGSCMLIHVAAADCTCGASARPTCDQPDAIVGVLQVPASRGVAIHANVASILYDPLLGTATPAATVRITGVRGLELRQVVNLMGRVRTCSAGSAAGLAAPC